MAKSKSSPKRRPLSLALQGGGAHGAFTWGVLERLSEAPNIKIKAITATSAGAMNAAAFAAGITKGGPLGARRTMEAFWREVSRQGAPMSVFTPPEIPEIIQKFNPFASMTPYSLTTAFASFASPYDTNPFDINPLREALDVAVDFRAVHESPVALHISATNVETGKVKIFDEMHVTRESVLASACLPQAFRAVEIDGVPYWDGGYMGNPSLFPLIYSKAPRDVLLVTLNPIARKGVPRSAGAIQDRMNEISFNAALIGELRSIAFVQKLLDQGMLEEDAQQRYRRMSIHLIRGGQAMMELPLETKYDTRWSFLTELRDRGRAMAETWLSAGAHHLGKGTSEIDLEDEFLVD